MRSSFYTRTRVRGFTLIEIATVIAILSLVAAGLSGAFRSLGREHGRTRAAAEEFAHLARTAAATARRDRTVVRLAFVVPESKSAENKEGPGVGCGLFVLKHPTRLSPPVAGGDVTSRIESDERLIESAPLARVPVLPCQRADWGPAKTNGFWHPWHASLRVEAESTENCLWIPEVVWEDGETAGAGASAFSDFRDDFASVPFPDWPELAFETISATEKVRAGETTFSADDVFGKAPAWHWRKTEREVARLALAGIDFLPDGTVARKPGADAAEALDILFSAEDEDAPEYHVRISSGGEVWIE